MHGAAWSCVPPSSMLHGAAEAAWRRSPTAAATACPPPCCCCGCIACAGCWHSRDAAAPANACKGQSKHIRLTVAGWAAPCAGQAGRCYAWLDRAQVDAAEDCSGGVAAQMAHRLGCSPETASFYGFSVMITPALAPLTSEASVLGTLMGVDAAEEAGQLRSAAWLRRLRPPRLLSHPFVFWQAAARARAVQAHTYTLCTCS